MGIWPRVQETPELNVLKAGIISLLDGIIRQTPAGNTDTFKGFNQKEFNKRAIYRDAGRIKGIYKAWWASREQLNGKPLLRSDLMEKQRGNGVPETPGGVEPGKTPSPTSQSQKPVSKGAWEMPASACLLGQRRVEKGSGVETTQRNNSTDYV